MKKRNITSLKLNKSTIFQLGNIFGGLNAETCEGPCQGGTGCCNWGTRNCPREPVTGNTGIFSGCPVC